MTASLSALWLSVQVTAAATVAILVLGIGLGLWLARTHVRGRVILETLVNLPQARIRQQIDLSAGALIQQLSQSHIIK